MRGLADDERLLAGWRHDIAKFAWDNFRFECEPWNRRVCEAAVARPKVRIGMQAAVGVGKSAQLAILGWHTLAVNGDQRTHHGQFPNGYALSISADNLKAGLWKELGVWYERSEFLKREFTYSAEQITHRQHPLQWWLRARSFPRTAAPETQGATLSGLHGPWVFVLLDEVGEMHPQIGRRAEQILSDATCARGLIAAAYNPTSIIGLGHEISTSAEWTVVRITGDPDDPHRSQRVDVDWARERIAKYGRDNPWVMAHILGQFPPGGFNTLLSPDDVRQAMAQNYLPETYIWSQKRIGVDIARFGGDRSVIFPRQGLVALMPTEMRHQDTNFIAAKLLKMAVAWGSEVEFIDDTGHWGHGVYDNLKASGRNVVAVNFADKKTLHPQYFNVRTEMLCEMAEWVKRGGALPNMPELIPEMTALTYYYEAGKIRVTEKDQIKKALGGKSYDLVDALALTFRWADQPATGITRGVDIEYNDLGDPVGLVEHRAAFDPHAGLP